MSEETKTPKSIAVSSYAFAKEWSRRDYRTEREAMAAHLVHALDTAQKYGVSREETAEAFLRLYRK